MKKEQWIECRVSPGMFRDERVVEVSGRSFFVDEKSVTNITDTPSGNESYITNGRLDFSFANRLTGCTSSSSQSFHTHFEDKDGEAQSHGSRYVTTSQMGCGGSVQTCLTTVAFHYGRGEIQFDRTEVACTTE